MQTHSLAHKRAQHAALGERRHGEHLRRKRMRNDKVGCFIVVGKLAESGMRCTRKLGGFIILLFCSPVVKIQDRATIGR